MAADSAPLAVVSAPEAASALLDPLRVRLLQNLRQPGSAASLARTLGAPRQRLNYHLRELERLGLVERVGERRRGNCVERLVRATARAYVVSPALVGDPPGDAADLRDRFSSAALIAAGAAMVRDVAAARTGAAKAGKRLATLALTVDVRFRSAADRAAFAAEMANAVARLVAKYHDEQAPGGRRFRTLVGCYPAPTVTQG